MTAMKSELDEMTLDGICGGWSGNVSNEAQGYVGQEVYLVKNDSTGRTNFIKVRLTDAEPVSKSGCDSVRIRFEVASDYDNPMDTNMNVWNPSDTQLEVGGKNGWQVYLNLL